MERGKVLVYLREQAFQALRKISFETISVLIRKAPYQIPQNLCLAVPSALGGLCFGSTTRGTAALGTFFVAVDSC